jgi:hypothetical protein
MIFLFHLGVKNRLALVRAWLAGAKDWPIEVGSFMMADGANPIKRSR